MVSFLSRIFSKSQPPAFDAASGGQQLVDPRLLLNSQRFHVGLRREDRLALYYSIYHSQPLAVGAVNILTRMCASRMIPKSGNPEVDRRMKQIWSDIRGDERTAQLMRQGLTYGFSIGEVCSDDNWHAVSRVVVPDSPLIRFVADKTGVITHVQQLAGLPFAPTDERSRIAASKCIIYQHNPASCFDYYGSSIFEAVCETLEYLCEVLKAEVAVIFRAGKPRFHVTVDNTGITPEQFRDRLKIVEAKFSELSNGNATDIYLPPGCEVKVIGGETLGVRVTEEVRCLIQNFLAAVGLPAPLLNVVTQASGGAEAFVRQQIISLQSMLYSLQDSVANAWNSSFWKIVQAVEGMPFVPRMEYEAPRLLEMLQEQQARQAQWQNDLAEVVAGIRDPEWLVQQCGADEAYDLDALTEYIDRQRSQPEPAKDIGSEETNKNGQTKYTDQQASGNTNG